MLSQYLRILWARKWLVLCLFVLVSVVGIAITLIAAATVHGGDFACRRDADRPCARCARSRPLRPRATCATQIEILKSERVASRAVKLLGVERSAAAVAQWRDATKAKIPLERYFADVLKKGLSIEPARGSNVSTCRFRARSDLRPGRRQRLRAGVHGCLGRAARRAGAPVGVVPRRPDEDPARQPRAGAGASLSKYQQTKGIVVTDERLDQENARYSALITQLAMAQAERIDTETRRRNTGQRDLARRPRQPGRDVAEVAACVGGDEADRDQQHRRPEPSAAPAARGADRRTQAAARRRDEAGRGRHVHVRPQQLGKGRRAAGDGRRAEEDSCLRCVPTATRSPSISATSTRHSMPTRP